MSHEGNPFLGPQPYRSEDQARFFGRGEVTRLLADSSGALARAGETSLRYAVRSARLALDHADEVSAALPEAA